MIGVLENGYIADENIDGETKRVCIGEGYLDAMRYKKFVDILEQKYNAGEVIYGSVEIIGRKENNNIIQYLNGFNEKGRVPTEFRYSGFAILGVAPADDTARLLEINNRKEMTQMNEEFKEIINNLKTRLDKSDEYKKQLEINQAEMDKYISEKNALLKEIEDLKTEKASLTAKLQECETNSENLKKELDELKSCSLKNELDSALADFTEAQKKFAKEAIEEFSKDPLNATNTIQDIINTILWNIGKEACELNKKKISERNSKDNAKNIEIDIFGEIVEDNSNIISIF